MRDHSRHLALILAITKEWHEWTVVAEMELKRWWSLRPVGRNLTGGLLDNVVRAQQQGLGNREAECLGGLEVDD
jgi:hypothetical protein